ncbi:MAG: hypothetical protein RIR26_1590 [Pseudomonadota bacterium]
MNTLLLAGASGRLGKRIFAASHDKAFHVVPLPREDFVGVDGKIEAVQKLADDRVVLIDVTLPEGTEVLVNGLLNCPPKKQISGVVIGSTGHSQSQTAKIHELGKRYPVVVSSNFSRGIYLFEEILQAKTRSGMSVSDLARQLGFDLSLWESHHTQKKDAPSGTARTLAHAATIPFDRIASTRVGAVVGEHSLFMSQDSEELRLTHVAHSRRLFADGALDLCERLFRNQLENGVYTMAEALGLLLKFG